jgi:hypothetical protein
MSDADTMRTSLRRRAAARDTYKVAHWDQYAVGLDEDFTPALPTRSSTTHSTGRPCKNKPATCSRVG